MALLKRRTRPKKETSLAERELLPERPAPSPEELKAFSAKFEAAKLDARQRLADGHPVIWVPSVQTTAKQRTAAGKEAQDGELEIDKILSRNSRSEPPGRKSDPAYDKAAYRRKVGEIFGRPMSVGHLAKDILSGDKSSQECKVEKMKQALKRRNKKRRGKLSVPLRSK